MQAQSKMEVSDFDFSDLSSELQFVLNTNGEILAMNAFAIELLQDQKTSFYDYFNRYTREDAYAFVYKAFNQKQKQSAQLYHTSFTGNFPVQYSAKLTNDHKLLVVGYVVRHEKNNNIFSVTPPSINSNKKLALIEFITKKLDLSVLLLDKVNKIEYCNERFKELIGFEGVIGNKKMIDIDTDHPLKHRILEMSSIVRHKQYIDEHYYYEKDSLYQFQGIYLEEEDSILFVVHDRSYQHRFENLLMYKQQMESVSQLAAGVAHELRNPLSVIRGFLQLSSLTNDWTKYYDTILSELTRMNDIIEDFLSVSRKKIEKQLQPPAEIFQSLIYIIRSECLLHNITFEYEIESTEYFVKVNESMIKQILLNLLRNAIEAFDELDIQQRKFVLKAVVKEHSQYVVSVEDNGAGIPTHVLEQLGKPFFTTKEKGNGIGIPLCKKIVDDHGGEFIVESEVGNGTMITFTLPLLSEGE